MTEPSGTGADAPAPPAANPVAMTTRGGRPGLGRLVAVVAVIVVLLGVGLGYWFLAYEPSHNVVTMEGGNWVINGASSSLGIQAGCSDCGQKPTPGSQFTIDLNVQVSSTSCGFFGCPGYSVQSFSIDTPYTLVSVAPSNLPYTESAGSFNTWALTISAPDSAGHYPLNGLVGVSYS